MFEYERKFSSSLLTFTLRLFLLAFFCHNATATVIN